MKFVSDTSIETGTKIKDDNYLSEDEVKYTLHNYLSSIGW